MSRGVNEDTKSLVEAYFSTIDANVKNVPGNITVWVQGLVPPTNITYNPKFPYRGTINDRLLYTILINYYLKHFANKYGYEFIDIFYDYADNNGVLLVALSDGNVHIRTYTESLKDNIANLIKKLAQQNAESN